MKLLEGKVAIITGADGIEEAKFFAKQGKCCFYIQFISRICGSFRKKRML
jgi:hypothetical protein